MHQLGISIYRLAGELGSSAALVALAYYALLQPFSDVDLRILSPEVKIFASVGLLSLLLFSIMVIIEIWPIRRIPVVPTARTGAQVEEERDRRGED